MISPSLLLCSVLKGAAVPQPLLDNKQDADFPRETAAQVELECNPDHGDPNLGFYNIFRETPAV